MMGMMAYARNNPEQCQDPRFRDLSDEELDQYIADANKEKRRRWFVPAYKKLLEERKAQEAGAHNE